MTGVDGIGPIDASGRSTGDDVDIASDFGRGKVKFNPEAERLALATKVLIGIGAIFVFTIGLNAAVQSPVTDKMFEECLKVLAPIATLILGAYFRGGSD